MMTVIGGESTKTYPTMLVASTLRQTSIFYVGSLFNKIQLWTRSVTTPTASVSLRSQVFREYLIFITSLVLSCQCHAVVYRILVNKLISSCSVSLTDIMYRNLKHNVTQQMTNCGVKFWTGGAKVFPHVYK